jgi:hypothetical protein
VYPPPVLKSQKIEAPIERGFAVALVGKFVR